VRRPFLRTVLDPELVATLLPPGSFRRFLADNIDRIASEEVVGDLFSGAVGRWSSIAPEYYLALILLRYHDKVSYEVASERAQFDARWKAVLGKSPVDLRPTVSAVSLFEFEKALTKAGRHDVLFTRTLALAREAGVLETEVTVAQDSTSVIGRGAVKDTYNLLGDGLRRLLRAVASSQGSKPLAVAERYGMGELFRRSTKATADIDWSSPDARRGFLQRLVEAAETTIEEVTRNAPAAGLYPSVRTAIAIVRKVIEQDVIREPSGRVSLRIGVAPDRLISIGDPEMRRGHKSQSEPFEGYKAHYTVALPSRIVMATEVTGANEHDSSPSAGMAERAEQSSGCLVVKVIGDAAYGTEANRVAHDEVGRILVAKLPRARITERFGKRDFLVDVEHNAVTCPAGMMSTEFTQIRRRREPDEIPSQISWMQRYVFNATICGACAQRSRCVPDGETRRRVDVGPNERLTQDALRYASTPGYRADRTARQAAEHTIARTVQLGARQARVRGRDKVAAQITLTAVVLNLTRLCAIARETSGPASGIAA